jgi:chemotaxis protein CheX
MRLQQCMGHVLAAVEAVLGQFRVADIKRESIVRKEELSLDYEVTTIIGLTGDANGNIAYSCSNETAKKLASMLMNGALVTEMDELGRSAIAELFNMISQNALFRMTSENARVESSQPSVIVGENVMIILTFMSTYCVTYWTPFGKIEVSFAVEL